MIQILKQDFETVPFHNFRIILKKEMELKYGGTCSDRTLYLKRKLDSLSLETFLHSAKIKGKEIHRLLKIEINNEFYFLDVGLGWPLMLPISLRQNMKYNFLGLHFKTEINGNEIALYKKGKKGYSISYNTTIETQEQDKIEQQINNRFKNIELYPFKDSIRFSKVVNNEFYFLKGNVLGYSENNEFKSKIIGSKEEYIYLFENIFKFDINLALEVANKTKMFKSL